MEKISRQRSLQKQLKRIRVSMVALTTVLIGVFAGMLMWSSSVHMHLLSGYQDLQDYYYSISEATDAVRDYLINGNSSDPKSYQNAIARARQSVSQLQTNPYLEQTWRFELLDNMVDSYVRSAEQLERQYGSNLKTSAYRSFYDDFLLQDALIQGTSVSYYHLLTDSMTQIQKYYSLIQAVCIVLAAATGILLIFWVGALDSFFKKDLAQPLRMISDNIDSIQDGQYFLCDQQPTTLEMQEVYQALRDMAKCVSRSHEVEKENLQLEKKLAQSKLKMLQNQINPHFLFNTLNTIYCLCDEGNSEQAAEMIFKTSHLLRYSLEMETRISTLGQEIRALQDYVEIQSMRRKGWIDFELIDHADALTMAMPMPPMILQPLVENSILHGLKDRMDQGKITVMIESDSDAFVIELKDNGAGVSAQRLEQLQNQRSHSCHTGLGLFNVIRRLEVFYGARFEYEFESAEGEFFLVRLIVRKEDPL